MDFQSAAAYNPNKEQTRPYVKFELRPTEDRTQTSPDGTCQMVDVAWAIVRAPGAKDSLEKKADDWLAQLSAYAKDGRVPPSWPSEYREAFALWRKGEEMPLNGTPIKTWPPLSPSQRANVLAAGLLTVEDLAQANDESRGKIGMGGHAIQQMAQNWLRESKDAGATAKALAAAQVLNEELRSTVANQSEQIAQLLSAAKSKTAFKAS
jgi:hypothetical protein